MERYKKEIERVFGVLDGVLAKQEWLVAGKPTVADLAFLQYVSFRSGMRVNSAYTQPRWTTGTFIYVEANDFKTQFPAVNAYVITSLSADYQPPTCDPQMDRETQRKALGEEVRR